MNQKCCVVVMLVAMATPRLASAVVLGFENFAQAGSVANVSPQTPYTESGFIITPTNAESAVFDSAATSHMIGNATDWFGFQETNLPSLRLTASTLTFNLQQLLVGPSTIATVPNISMTITGNVFGGGSLNATFTGLTTATTETLNWLNLSSVVFTATDDAGLDNISVTPVPEPASLSLMAAALIGAIALGAYFRQCREDNRA